MLWKILEKIFITKKITQCRTSCTLKIDILETPDKIKILENCFQNMNYFSWIKLIPNLIYLKYWYYNSPYLELPCLPHLSVKFCPSKLKPLFKTILIMLFIGFPILHYSILSYDTTSIGYTEPCAKPSYWNLLSSCIKITTLYGSNMLPIKKLSLYELLLFQS